MGSCKAIQKFIPVGRNENGDIMDSPILGVCEGSTNFSQ